MPREVVMKKLRERQEPIRLFGESDYDAFFRLRKLELGCQEQYKIKGWTNEIKEAMEQMDDEDISEVTKSMSRGDAKAEKKYNIIYKYEHPEVTHDWLLENRQLLKVRQNVFDQQIFYKTINRSKISKIVFFFYQKSTFLNVFLSKIPLIIKKYFCFQFFFVIGRF